MFDLRIACLRLNIDNADGHEHRVHPIALRAASLFAERLAQRLSLAGGMPVEQTIDELGAPPLSLDLSRMSDEEASEVLAGAWIEALALQLEVEL